MTTALVTGAGGLIGAHIVRALLEGLQPAGARSSGRVEARARRPRRRMHRGRRDGRRRAEARLRRLRPGVPRGGIFLLRARLLARALRGRDRKRAARRPRRRSSACRRDLVFGRVRLSRERGRPADRRVLEPISRDERPAYVAAKIAQYLRALAVADEIGLEVALTCPTITVGPTSAPLGASNGLILAYLNDPFCRTYPGGCNIAAAADVARGHLLVAERGEAGESYLLGAENLAWRDVHATIAELAGLRAPAFELNHTTAYLAAAAEELMSAIGQRPPLTTRDQAAMIGRCYWYSHAKAAHLGYAPQPARAALAAAVSWLAASPHVSREVRAGLRLSDEIYRLRAYDARESVG